MPVACSPFQSSHTTERWGGSPRRLPVIIYRVLLARIRRDADSVSALPQHDMTRRACPRDRRGHVLRARARGAEGVSAHSGNAHSRTIPRLLAEACFSGSRRQVLRASPRALQGTSAVKSRRRFAPSGFAKASARRGRAKTPLLLTVSREAPFRLLPRVRHVAEVQLQPHLATKQEGKEIP
jgi:hypothetical protein